MTAAPALNTASIAQPGAAHANAPTAAAGGMGALAGFDALVAALFPQGAPTEAAGATATGPAQAAPLLAPTTDVQDADADAEAQLAAALPEGQPADAEAAAADAETAAAILATLVAPQPAATPPAAATAAGPDAAERTPHAWGRDKAKGAPAQPALVHANSNANLAEKAGLTPPSADGETPETPAQAPQAATPSLPQQAAAPQRPAPQAAAQAQANAAAHAAPAPAADAAPEVATAPPPASPEPAPLENAPPALQAQAMAAHERREPAHTQQAPPAKSERGKVAADAAAPTDPKAVDPADKPLQAKAVDGAAKSASAKAEGAEPKAAEAEVPAEAPDAAAPAETRAAAQSAAPTAHTTHAVRGSPETVAHLAAQIIKKLEGQSTRFDLELNPQGLGKVDVRIEIGAHGQLTAAMLFDNQQAATELRARATELQRALEQAGFDLSGGLSFDVAGDHRQQGQPWQDQPETGSAFRGQAFRAALETAGDVADAAAQGALRLRRGVNAGLDLRI